MTTHGFNLHTVGVILMVVGIVGLVISLLWMTLWASRRDRVAPVAPVTRREPPEPELY